MVLDLTMNFAVEPQVRVALGATGLCSAGRVRAAPEHPAQIPCLPLRSLTLVTRASSTHLIVMLSAAASVG